MREQATLSRRSLAALPLAALMAATADAIPSPTTSDDAALLEIGRRWRVGEINGRQSGAVNEAVRVTFQTGALDVVVFTVTEAISLHQNEMPGGERTRALIVHDMRHSAIQLAQIEGRCHRDGEKALIFYAYAEGTVEKAITATVTRRMASMEAMAGEDTSLLKDIAAVVEAAAA